MAISERKKRILTAVVEEYIKTAEPVGSKTIAGTSCLGCSSATIRNELAELTSMGYLEQPHTSAGRVPTSQGYRMYVNELMEKQKLSSKETEEINHELDARIQALDNAIADIGKLASNLTNYPALAITAPTPATIQRFDLIYIDANTFIIVVMLSNNTVRNKLVHLPVSVDQAMIRKLETVFNANFTWLTEDRITPLLISATERSVADAMGLSSVIASFAIEVLTEAEKTSAFVTGESSLLRHPEFRDPDKAQALMSYLSNSQVLRSIPTPENRGSAEVKVLIGPENVADELKDSSVVIASYDAGDNMRGLIGVVGPTRMDYSKIAAKLGYIADELSRRLGTGELPPGMNKLMIKGDDKS